MWGSTDYLYFVSLETYLIATNMISSSSEALRQIEPTSGLLRWKKYCSNIVHYYHLNILPLLKPLSRWLFKFLKVDSIHLSSRSLSAVIYLKVVGAQNHQTILSYRTFGSKEYEPFFTTEHSVVKNPICSLLPNIW